MSNLHTVFLPWRELSGWSDLVETSPQRTIFATASWMESVEDAFEDAVRVLAVLDDDTPVAALPMRFRRRAGVRAAIPFPFSLYNGLVLSASCQGDRNEAHRHRVMEEALTAAREHVDTGSFSLHPTLIDVRPFQWQPGWGAAAQYTSVVDLHTETEAAYSQALRRKLRQAVNDGMEVVTVSDPAMLISLHEQSYGAHHRMAPFAGPATKRLIETLARTGCVHLAECRSADGAVLAARAMLVDGSMAYDWIAGRATGDTSGHASHHLVHSMLCDMRARGCTHLDFMGANTAGILDFKRAFGGRLVPHHEVTFHRTPALEALLRLRARLRRIP